LKAHQWFDTWHLTTDDEERTDHETLMAGGLWASCPFIGNLLEQEIEIIGRENVVLWGLTQGCAISLASLLTWESEPFAAVVGMCEWLPLGNHIWEIVGVDVHMVEYEGLPVGRWYSEEMLKDIFRFLRDKLGRSKEKTEVR
jgi:hypothetical protein